MTNPIRIKREAYVLAKGVEEENIKLRFELQKERAEANRQYRRAAQFEELLIQARQEIAILQASASRALMDYQQGQARRNGAGR